MAKLIGTWLWNWSLKFEGLMVRSISLDNLMGGGCRYCYRGPITKVVMERVGVRRVYGLTDRQ